MWELGSNLSLKDTASSTEGITWSSINYLPHLINGSRFIKKSGRKCKQLHDQMTISSLALTCFCLIVFLFSQYFCLLSNFKISRCIVKLLIIIQQIFVEVQLKKEKLKRVFGAPNLGHPNWYTSLQNSRDMSLL